MQIPHCLAGPRQLPECNVLLRPLKRKKARILFHIWHTLISRLSDFKWKVQRVLQKGHRCRSHVPLINASLAPPNTTMRHCVKLFALLCFHASCSNSSPRCESLLHNKYRKGVCRYVKCGKCMCVSTLVFFLSQRVSNAAGLS